MGVSLSAVADVRSTPHNMTQGGMRADPGEVCVFCHTPVIGALSAAKGPAWQARVGIEHVFSLYDDIGRQGEGAVPTVGSQSIACLSCHDSNQAFSVTQMHYDHPFGVPYRGYDRLRLRQDGGAYLRRLTDSPFIEARHLKGLLDFRVPVRGSVDNRTVWWVPVTADTVRRSRGDLPLFVRRDRFTGEERPYIECSSCHDPHNTNRQFLRQSNETSTLCLVCHEK
jgi:predicted CXXCH cytochrome family protein